MATSATQTAKNAKIFERLKEAAGGFYLSKYGYLAEDVDLAAVAITP